MILGPSLALGTLLSLLSGPLGCLMIWQNLSYFGDCLAHSALLGLALALIFSVSVTWGLTIACIAVAVATHFVTRKNKVSPDTLLNIISQCLLSLGVILVYHNPSIKFDMQAILFGDILNITWEDVQFYALISLILAIILKTIWNSMLKITLSEELAHVNGLKVQRLKFLFQMTLSVFYGVSIKLIGGLLSSGLLILPAISARLITHHPGTMALTASFLTFLSTLLGLLFSVCFDYPTGPSMICIAALILILSAIFLRKK